MLALLAALSLQDAWWDAGWKLRRALTVRNGTDAAFEAGRPVDLEIDLDFLSLRDKARPGLADLAVVRGGRRIAHVLRPSADGRRFTLTFPLGGEIASGASDVGYALYYGNPEGKPPEGRPFPFFQDFSSADGLDLGALTGGARDGALELRDAPAERTAITPERLELKTARIPDAFAISFDLEAVFANTPALAVCLEIALLDPALAGADLKPAAALIERLNADDLEVRERATLALIALGPEALPALADAIPPDAEVRTRVERIVAAIRKKAPPSVIRAGLVCSDILWKTAAVAGASASQGAGRPADGSPRRFRFEVTRDPEGHVTVSCDGQRLQRGVLKAPPGRVSIVAWKTAAVKPAPIRIDNVFIRTFVDPEERPATTIDVEVARP
jgi:hypothetical protein